MRYRKLPVVVDASQWFNHGDNPNVRRYPIPFEYRIDTCAYCNRTMLDHGWIETLEGGHIVCPEDWIITGVNGETYPCKPDIFRKTYEPAPE